MEVNESEGGGGGGGGGMVMEGGRDETDGGEFTEVSLLLCILPEHFVEIVL